MKAYTLSLTLLVVGVLSSFTYISHENTTSLEIETAKKPLAELSAVELSTILESQLKHLHHLDLIDLANVPSIHPLVESEHIQLGSPFGMRKHPIFKIDKLHKGIDFSAPIGTPVIATADGFIVKTVNRVDFSGYGRHIKIEHDEVFQDEDYATLYAHLSDLLVSEGDQVARGDTIGYTGNSGTSTNPHLHYEVIRNGEQVDPVDFLM